MAAETVIEVTEPAAQAAARKGVNDAYLAALALRGMFKFWLECPREATNRDICVDDCNLEVRDLNSDMAFAMSLLAERAAAGLETALSALEPRAKVPQNASLREAHCLTMALEQSLLRIVQEDEVLDRPDGMRPIEGVFLGAGVSRVACLCTDWVSRA